MVWLTGRGGSLAGALRAGGFRPIICSGHTSESGCIPADGRAAFEADRWCGSCPAHWAASACRERGDSPAGRSSCCAHQRDGWHVQQTRRRVWPIRDAADRAVGVAGACGPCRPGRLRGGRPARSSCVVGVLPATRAHRWQRALPYARWADGHHLGRYTPGRRAE